MTQITKDELRMWAHYIRATITPHLSQKSEEEVTALQMEHLRAFLVSLEYMAIDMRTLEYSRIHSALPVKIVAKGSK